MAKRYNITFNNESEYLSFKASSAYYEPNVSLTLDDNKVHFNPAPISVTGVSLDSSSIEISEGETQSLVATVLPTNATDKSVTWSTSDSSVATVDANGLVTAVANGNCTITVTTNDGGYTAQCTVEVATLETRVVAKFSVSDTSSPTRIIGEDWDEGGYSSAFTAIEIDGVAQPSVVSAYTFSTTGEHTVKYTLADTTTIGLYAFCNCGSLTSVTIPNSVTSIGHYAFYDCSSLTSCTIGSGVTSIGNGAFEECSNLSSITVDSSNTTYDSRDNCNAIIQTSTNTLVVGCKSTVIPNSVTSIGNDAFSDCNSLTSIDIPNSVTTIGFGAFNSCNGLTSCTIGSSVTSINGSAFYDCSSLTSIIIPNSVTTIDSDAFGSCDSLTSITIPSGVTSIGFGAFDSCSNLTSVTVNATTPPTLGSYAFSNTNNCPIYVPSGSVSNYKSATNWSTYSSRIQAIT